MTKEEFKSLKFGDVIEWRLSHKTQPRSRFVFIGFRDPAKSVAPYAISGKSLEATLISLFTENWVKVDTFRKEE